MFHHCGLLFYHFLLLHVDGLVWLYVALSHDHHMAIKEIIFILKPEVIDQYQIIWLDSSCHFKILSYIMCPHKQVNLFVNEKLETKLRTGLSLTRINATPLLMKDPILRDDGIYS